MEEITWSALLTLPGAAAAVTVVITVLKAVFGTYWTDLANKIAALVLSVGIVVGVTIISGAVSWETIILAVLNGFIVAGAMLGVTNVYNQRIVEDKLTGKSKK